MTSATLFREGDDLDELLADLDEEHPGQVRVVEVTYDRDGGVLGFFARRKVGVHYVVDDVRAGSSAGKPAATATATATAPAKKVTAATAARSTTGRKTVTAGPIKATTASTTRTGAAAGRRSAAGSAPVERETALEDLLRAAEMVESGQAPDLDPSDADVEAPNVEFARMLLEMAAQKAADRLANGEPAALPFQETIALATSAAEKFVAEPAAGAPAAERFVADALSDPAATDPFATDPFVTDPFVTDADALTVSAIAELAATAAPPVRSTSQLAAAKFATSQFTAAAPVAVAAPVASAAVAPTVPIAVAPTVPIAVAPTAPVAAAPAAPVVAPLPPAPPAPRIAMPTVSTAPSAPTATIAPAAPAAPSAPPRPVAVPAHLIAAAARPLVAPTPPPARTVTAPVAAAPVVPAPVVPAPVVPAPVVQAPVVPAAVVPASAVINRLATSRPQVGRRRAPEVEPAASAAARDSSPEPVVAQPRRRAGAHRAAPESGRSQFHVRRQLSEVGVPVAWIPEECGDAYWAIETLVTALPTATLPDPGPGEILVVVGTAVEALDAARQLCTRLRLDPATIHTAGCPGSQTELVHRWQAAALGSQIRSNRTTPAIVVVATDDRRASDDADDRWVASMVKALGPDHLLAVVDASRKAADCRSLLSALGPVDALWLTGAARTSSPASVWELDVPVAMLDGRPATRGAWAALLIDKLIALES